MKPAVDLADGEWHHLHPATPFLKGGIALIAILGIVITNLRERLIEWFFPMFECPPGVCEEDPISVALNRYLIFVLLGIFVVLLVIIGLFWVSWRMNTLRVTDEVVEIRQGVVFRSHRKARLDRIQGINIQRSLFARIFGAAKLEISGAGAESNMQLAYLSGANADALRAELLRRASGLRAREAADAVARAEADAASEPGDAARVSLAEVARQRLAEFSAPELDPSLAPPQSVVTMSAGRLVGSTLLNAGTWIFLLAIVGVVLAMSLTDAGGFVFFGLIPMVFGFGSYVVNRVVKSLRYSIAATPDGVRVGFGLLSTSNETIPPGRIHAVEISQDLLWRPFDWWTVRVNLASRSLSSSANAQLTTTILPVGSRAEVFKVLELVLPSLMSDETRALVEGGLLPARPEDGFTTSPRRGAVLRWFSWRRNGFLLHPDAVVLRRGALWRSLAVVPTARTQSVAVSQGPLERALRLAKVRLHTVQGPVTPSLGALDVRDASALFRDTATASVAAIRADRTHRWGSA
ncbi:PH domain-containing protein [Protaetiibacter sp. SSC-01]|uniref:PH domain-containing protein n=1 Tax=Protaetiibacter sp. SSC-01 TaxID=2759943 RepID=UPI001656C2A6|nr:PH domain-containing protein [Protaetiibacter sp. SSC-01]QNO37649.1 PH domain-containing protein [Protaetiibacter sp. SSC-01]